MHYQTRHLEALADFAHGQTQVRKGDRFPASDIDADFYIARGKAKEAQAPVAPPATQAAVERPSGARPAKRASPAPEHARPAAKRAANAGAVAPMTAADVRPGEPTPTADAPDGGDTATDGKA